jgi:hypothetical protein
MLSEVTRVPHGRVRGEGHALICWHRATALRVRLCANRLIPEGRLAVFNYFSQQSQAAQAEQQAQAAIRAQQQAENAALGLALMQQAHQQPMPMRQAPMPQMGGDQGVSNSGKGRLLQEAKARAGGSLISSPSLLVGLCADAAIL